MSSRSFSTSGSLSISLVPVTGAHRYTPISKNCPVLLDVTSGFDLGLLLLREMLDRSLPSELERVGQLAIGTNI
jgi:hypothetical protein